MSTTHCTQCGVRISANRRWCVPCATERTRQRFARERADRVELIEDYLLLGISADRIAADFDVTPGALARQMHRIGQARPRETLPGRQRLPWQTAPAQRATFAAMGEQPRDRLPTSRTSPGPSPQRFQGRSGRLKTMPQALKNTAFAIL